MVNVSEEDKDKVIIKKKSHSILVEMGPNNNFLKVQDTYLSILKT